MEAILEENSNPDDGNVFTDGDIGNDRADFLAGQVPISGELTLDPPTDCHGKWKRVSPNA